jgi:hypothetical protein
MVAVYGNLMVMGIAAALFFATVNLGKRRDAAPPSQNPGPTTRPAVEP